MSGFVRCGGGGNGGGGYDSGSPRLLIRDFINHHSAPSSFTENDWHKWLNVTGEDSFVVSYPNTLVNKENGFEGVAFPIIGLDFFKTYRITCNYKCNLSYRAEQSGPAHKNGCSLLTRLGNLKGGYKKLLSDDPTTNGSYDKHMISQYTNLPQSIVANTVYPMTLDYIGGVNNFAILAFNFCEPIDKAVTHTITDIKIEETNQVELISSSASVWNASASNSKLSTTIGYDTTETLYTIPMKFHITGKCVNGTMRLEDIGLVSTTYSNTAEIDDYLLSTDASIIDLDSGSISERIPNLMYTLTYTPDTPGTYSDDHIQVDILCQNYGHTGSIVVE